MKTKKRSPKTKMKGEKHNVSSIDEDLAPILKAFELQDFELMQRRSEILLATPHVPAVYAKVRHFLGLSFLLQWKVTQALPHLRHAAHDLPKDPDVWDHLGVALNRAGYRSEAEDCYRNVFALNPNRADTFINAAKNAFESHRYKEAEQYAKKAVEMQPGSAKAHGNMGNALREQGRLQEAVRYYQEAIRLDPFFAEAHNSLGATYCKLNDFASAMEVIKKAVQLSPRDAPSLNNLAILHKQLGETSTAITYARQAIAAMMAAPYTKPPALQDYMNVEVAHQALLALKTALGTLGVPFFLAYGSLLGVVRDGKLLPHDKDMDVGLPWETDREALISALEKNHGFVRNMQPPPSPEGDAWNISVIHIQTGIVIDFFFFKRDGHDLISGIHHLPVPLYWRFSRFNTRPFDYIGQTWQVPDPPEQFLEEIYGPNWRTPDAHFDSLLSGYNRNPEASDVALCFAYNRLFDRMDRSEWKKAAGYCRQILTKKPDSFIEEVNQWLEQRIQQQGSAT